MNLPFDPIKRSLEIEQIVMQMDERMYYRFRFANFYGGIIKADTIGCNLLCAHAGTITNACLPKGKFWAADDAARKIVEMCHDHDGYNVRISGAETILGEASARHFKAVMEASMSYPSISMRNVADSF